MSSSCAAVDNGVLSVRAIVRDKDGGQTEYTGTVTVSNVAPVLGPISLSATLVPVGVPVTVSASFTDPGLLDTHIGSVQWDAGQLFDPADQIALGSRVVSASRSLPTGVYSVTLRVRDKDGGEDSRSATEYIVVYDPSGGFVTGGGWIQSPAGAYASDPTLTGAANFGFVAKYKQGANTPDGNTEFHFKAGALNFHSTNYEWLVIAGSKAMYKGEGTLNGTTGYRFQITAIDGDIGTKGPDRFRIKIWSAATGSVTYDNKRGAADDADDATALGGGSIVIHKP